MIRIIRPRRLRAPLLASRGLARVHGAVDQAKRCRFCRHPLRTPYRSRHREMVIHNATFTSRRENVAVLRSNRYLRNRFAWPLSLDPAGIRYDYRVAPSGISPDRSREKDVRRSKRLQKRRPSNGLSLRRPWFCIARLGPASVREFQEHTALRPPPPRGPLQVCGLVCLAAEGTIDDAVAIPQKTCTKWCLSRLIAAKDNALDNSDRLLLVVAQ